MLTGVYIYDHKTFVQLGFNDADTLGPSSILIYSQPEQRLFTQSNWHDAMVIKGKIKKKRV
jgi:hypothetical protein